MADVLQSVQTVLAVVSSLLYIYVGVMTGRRSVPDEARTALRAWQAWWVGLGLVGLLATAVNPWLERAGSETLYLAYILPVLVIVLAIVAALVYYLLYLYTGNARVLTWALLYFGALTVFYVVLFLGAFSPEGYPHYERVDGENTFLLGPDGDVTETLTLVAGIFLILPLLGSAVAYALLYFRLDGATERYRIAMVSGALVVWFGSSFLGTILTGVFGDLPDWWPVATQGIALAAATMVLVAYYPLRAWKRRYGLRSLRDER